MMKKLAKILLWVGIVLVTIFLISYVAIRIFFPVEKLKRILISQIESTIQRPVTVDKLSFNPIKGFALENVIFFDHAIEDSSVIDRSVFLSARHIHLSYRLLSLLNRVIEIKDVLIDHPVMNLMQDQQGRWNFDDLLTTFIAETTTVTADTGTIEFRLPVTLKLKKFRLNDFTINVVIDQAETLYTIKSGGISLRIDDLYLPRKTFKDITQNASASVQIVSDHMPWQVTMKTKSPPETIAMSTELQLTVNISASGLKKIDAQGNLALANFSYTTLTGDRPIPQQYKFPLSNLTSTSFELAINLEEDVIFLKQFFALLGEEKLFDIDGMVTDFLNQPMVDLRISNSKIRLHNLVTSFAPLLPDTIQNLLQPLSVTGWASFSGTTVQGKPLSENLADAMTLNILCSIHDVNAQYREPETRLNNLKINAQLSTSYNLHGFQTTDFRMNLMVDTLSVSVDTTNFVLGDIDFKLTSTLDSEFMPDTVVAFLAINQFFEVPLNFNFHFKSIDRLNKYRATGDLAFRQLPLKKLPDLMMDGVLDCVVHLNSESLDRIDLNLTVASDVIDLKTETGLLTIKPITVQGDAVLATDTTFRKIDMKQLALRANDFATALMHGDFVMGKQQVLTLIMDQIAIDHKRAMKIMPRQLLEGYENLTLSGKTELTSKLSVTITEDLETVIQADGHATVHAGVSYPDIFFTLGTAEAQLNFHSDGISATMDMQAVLDNIVVEGVRDLPLRDVSLVATGAFPDFETFIIDSARMALPDLKTSIFLTARIDSLSGNMRTRVIGDLDLDTRGTSVILLNLLQATGKMSHLMELDLAGDIATITGRLVIDELDLKYEELATVDSMTGEIHFFEKFDVEKGIIVASPTSRSFLAKTGAFYYDLLRPYYQLNHDQFSHFRIRKVQAQDYYATNIECDLVILNESIIIPRFSLNAYDGNMSGLLYANIHEGEPEQIEWKVKANLSRLNSAKLVPTRKVKTEGSDLNLNLELSGIGIDPATQLEVVGSFYVTKIGPQFMENVLRSLDPKGTDKSIQDTRKLIRWGYKPGLISVEIKHGNLYPTIHLEKASLLTKLIPLNLSGGKIELARIPIKFFLTNIPVE